MAPFVIIAHDSDNFDINGNQIPAVNTQVKLSPEFYLPNWQTMEMNYSPTLNSTSATLSLILIPNSNSSTEVKFKDLVFEKTFNNNLVLEEINNVNIQKLNTAEIAWKKIDATQYELTLKNQKLPFILVFSETFHPMWKILDQTGKEINLPHFSINGYANAWLIEKPLPDNIKIKFLLQGTRNQGIVVSAISMFLLIAAVICLDHRRRING